MYPFNDASGAEGNIHDYPFGELRSNRWLQSRTLFLRQPITDEVANQLIAQLVYLDSANPNAAIQLYIHTEAGSVAAGLAIYDTIQNLRSPVHTLCTGVAAGIGSLLLAFSAKRNSEGTGTPSQRSAQPHARIRLAQPETRFTEGTAYEIETAAREVFRQRHILYELYAEVTG